MFVSGVSGWGIRVLITGVGGWARVCGGRVGIPFVSMGSNFLIILLATT